MKMEKASNKTVPTKFKAKIVIHLAEKEIKKLQNEVLRKYTFVFGLKHLYLKLQEFPSG